MIRYQKNAVKVRKSDGTMVEVGLLGEGNSTQDLTNDVNRIETEINSLIGNEIATEKVGCVLYETGVFSTSANFKYSEYIPVAAGQFVIVKDCKCQGNIATIAYFNSNKVYDKSKSIPGITLSTENDYSAKIESDGFVVICRHKDNTNVIASVIANTKDIYDDLEEVKSKTDKMIAIDETPTADTEIAISLDEDLEECELVEKSELDEVKNDISDLEDTVDTKVGYSEVANNQLKMYRDSSKTVLLATLDLPTQSNVKINGTETEDNNIPIGTTSNYGVFKLRSGSGIATNTDGSLRTEAAGDYAINNRASGGSILPTNLDKAVKAAMCDGIGADWTDAEKLSARQRIGLDKEWVLKGELTVGIDGVEDATSVNVDLTECTEISLTGYIRATGDSNLSAIYIGTGSLYLCYQFCRNGDRTVWVECSDDEFGIKPIVSRYGGALNSRLFSATLTAYATNGMYVSQITDIKIDTPSVVTLCDIKIYAR